MTLAWQNAAACAGLPTHWFFVDPAVDRGPKAQAQKIARARSICAGCPVTDACLTFALAAATELELDHGIWAGTTPGERQILRTERSAA